MKKAVLLLLITFCCVEIHAQCTVPNGDFEKFSEYESVIPHPGTGLTYPYWLPDDGWTESVYQNNWGRITAGQGFFQKYDEEDADGFALGMKGSGNNGFIRFECNEAPQKLKGRYKFSNNGCDNFYIYTYAVNKADTLTMEGLHWAEVHETAKSLLVTPTDTFVDFEIDMTDFEGVDVDYITIMFKIAPNGDCSGGDIGGTPIIVGDGDSLMIIDDLELVYPLADADKYEVETSSIKIYPNPSSDIVYIQNNSSGIINNIALYTIRGQMIFNDNQVIGDKDLTINISNQPQGIYFLKLTTDKGTTETFKIVKQ